MKALVALAMFILGMISLWNWAHVLYAAVLFLPIPGDAVLWTMIPGFLAFVLAMVLIWLKK